MLNIKNITKRFNNNVVLNNVALSVPAGSIALLLGPSGVGKSTLLRILNSLEAADYADITLDGTPITITKGKHNPTFGIVFQHFNLFDHLTVLENITVPLEVVQKKTKEEAKAIAMALLTEYGLQDKAHAFVSQLSGGQKQRLAIARTLAFKPRVICFDEPTSALDPIFTSYIATIMQQLTAQGYIVIVATHDTSLVEKVSGIIHLMKQGVIIESANTQDFYKHRQNYPSLNSFMSGHVI